MAEMPPPKVPDDPLKAQLGEEEWKRLTDERARLQQQDLSAPRTSEGSPLYSCPEYSDSIAYGS